MHSTALRTLLLLLAGAVLTPSARAQSSDLAFLRVGTNAAAGAMGDASVAHSRDAFSTYWNPAGLAAAPTNSLALSYHAWVADVQTYALATRFRAGERGGFGLFVTAQGADDLEARTAPGDPDGTFNVQYISTGVAYGRAFGPVRAGITAKFLSERIYTERANGYAVDLGLQADVLQNGLQLGVAYQNLGEMNELATDPTALPRTLRAGAAVFPFRILTFDDNATLLSTMVAAEVVHLFSTETTQLHLGAGVRLFDVLDFRGGYITNDALRQFTLGLGLNYESFRFDYAYLPFENDFQGPGHLLTLSYDW